MTENFLQTFTATLKSTGKSDKEIADVIDSLAKSAFSLLFADAMAVFSEDDIIAIEKCDTPEETEKKVFALYVDRTGKNPKEEVTMLLGKFMHEYMTNLQNAVSEEK